MQPKSAFSRSEELRQVMFSITAKTLDSVDVIRAKSEFIVAMIDPQVLVATQTYQVVITAPTVCVDDRFQARFTANNGL